jgi:hypothetical protein
MSDTGEPKQVGKLAWVQSPNGVVQIYTNSMHTTWTLDDVRLRLGQINTSHETLTPGPGYMAVVEERADVTFSWRAAKILVGELLQIIQSYEKENGEIVIDIKLPSANP